MEKKHLTSLLLNAGVSVTKWSALILVCPGQITKHMRESQVTTGMSQLLISRSKPFILCHSGLIFKHSSAGCVPS